MTKLRYYFLICGWMVAIVGGDMLKIETNEENATKGGNLDTKFDLLHTANAANIKRTGNVDVINVNGRDLGFCHIGIFLGRSVSWVLDAPALTGAALLAMNMLNNGDGSVIEELGGLNKTCPIRFTGENFDTAHSPALATNKLLEVLGRTVEEKKLCAMLGPQRSAVALPLAIIGGLQGLPQVGFSARTTDLDDKSQYPIHARVNSSQKGDAAVYILYLKKLGVTHLGLIHWNDAFGNDFGRSMLQVSAQIYPELTIVVVDLDSQRPDHEEAISIMAKTGFRYFLCFFVGPRDFAPTLMEAAKQGIAGTGEHTWLFSATVSLGVVSGLQVVHNSALAAAVNGVGLVTAIAGLTGMPVRDKFEKAWRSLDNEHDLAYLASKKTQGESRNYTSASVFVSNGQPAAFMFDSTVLLGMAACRAAARNYTFDGRSLFDAMLNVSFQGATGHVILDGSTGTRLSSTGRYMLTNFVRKEINETHVGFEGTNSEAFIDGEWTTLVPYVYNDGTTFVPPDLPRYEMDYNYIGLRLRITGLCMAAVVWLLASSFAGWTTLQRNQYVVRASQPIFLLILCAGTFIMGAAIIPLSIDDGITSDEGCNIACMAIPWLTSTGFVMTFAALFSKTWRVNRIFNNPTLRRIKVTVFDVMRPLIVLLMLNIVVLSVWTAVSPLTWTRETTDEDVFNRPTESRGYCYSDDYLPFVVVIVGLDIGALMFASYQSYLARGVSTEFAESEYIGRAIACMLLVSFVGVPTILFVSDEPRARFFVLSSILFVLCTSVLLFIFVPKILFAKSNPDGSAALKSSVRSATVRIKEQAHLTRRKPSASQTEASSKPANAVREPKNEPSKESRASSCGVVSGLSVDEDGEPSSAEVVLNTNVKRALARISIALQSSVRRETMTSEGDTHGEEGIKVFNTQQELAFLMEENEAKCTEVEELQAQVGELVQECDDLRLESKKYREQVSELQALLSKDDDHGGGDQN